MCVAVYGKYLPTFRSNALPPSSEIRSSRRHVGKHLPKGAA